MSSPQPNLSPWAMEYMEKERQALVQLYGDLPPLSLPPPNIPLPDYFVDGRLQYSTDDSSRVFYTACSTGELREVRRFATGRDPPCPIGDLQYGLEKAAVHYQIDVVRYLLQECNVPLHGGVLDVTFVIPAQRTGTSSHNKLPELFAALLDNGYHPNQSWQHKGRDPTAPYSFQATPRSSRPSLYLALHQPACLRSPAITKLLLDHGADPTRGPAPCDWSEGSIFRPDRLRTPALLVRAARIGGPETVKLLLAHGAKRECAPLLHIAARRYVGRELGLEEAWHRYIPDGKEEDGRDARFWYAEFVLGLGEDINALRDVGEEISSLCTFAHARPLRDYEATALSHAVGFQDWEFVEWLLERGADPDAHRGLAFRQVNDRLRVLEYGCYEGKQMDQDKAHLRELVAKSRKGALRPRSG